VGEKQKAAETMKSRRRERSEGDFKVAVEFDPKKRPNERDNPDFLVRRMDDAS
jgi:5,10-methylenetetrahydrofolate reductase